MKTEPERVKAAPDQELMAIRRILAIVEGLSEPARGRVMLYVSQRIYPGHAHVSVSPVLPTSQG